MAKKKIDVEFFMRVLRHPCSACVHFISDHENKKMHCELGRPLEGRKRRCRYYKPLWDPKDFLPSK